MTSCQHHRLAVQSASAEKKKEVNMLGDEVGGPHLRSSEDPLRVVLMVARAELQVLNPDPNSAWNEFVERNRDH